MENFSPYIITGVDHEIDRAANLPTARDIAQRYADEHGERVYIVGHLLGHRIEVNPKQA